MYVPDQTGLKVNEKARELALKTLVTNMLQLHTTVAIIIFKHGRIQIESNLNESSEDLWLVVAKVKRGSTVIQI